MTIETAPIPNGEMERILRVVVAPEQRFAIVRHATAIRLIGGVDWTEYSTMEARGHQEHRSGQWLPARAVVEEWLCNPKNDKPRALLTHKEFEFEGWDLDPNPPESVFEYEFPDGAVVTDRVAGETYRVRIVDGKPQREKVRTGRKTP